jgi:PAS domain S-box-containing protein
LAALFAQWRERRRAQRALAELVRFEKNFADVSTSFITVRSDGIQGAVRNALRRLLEGADADRAVIYEASDSRTLHWKALFSESRPDLGTCETSRDWDADLVPSLTARLRAGHVVTLLDTSTREELLASAPETLAPAAAVVVPLIVGTDMLGVLWCIWLRQPTIKLRHDVVVERFRLIGELLANALRRSQIEAKLAETTDLNAAILQSLTLNVAVLDRTGTIIAVNDAWVKFGRQNGVSPESAILPGANYVEPVRKAADEGVPDAREALQGVRDVCERRRDLFTLEYECSSPGHQRWFVMTVAALRWHGGGAVVTHRDITESKQIEIATRESESRFRLLADALPVGVWMSDSESRRIYFNRTWVEYTGQSIGWQLGDGWTHTLHPDDRQRYLDVYRAAFEAREPFSIEYRIRRHSGGYGWFLDTAVPRYGDDGSFRGYVGGCLDVTERKEVEDALRDLAGRVISAEEEDRRRVARELHDGVSQLVALLAIEIEQTGQTPIRTQEDLTARTHALWERTAEISRELHRQAHALHPSRLETFGLVAALEGYCREISEQQQVRVLFSHTGLSLSTPPDIALCVFRVVQEALRNTVKHSGAREATVELVGDHDRVFLRVSDGGAGFDTAERYAGLGLVSMRERVRYAGGVLDITSHTGQGTRIEVELPLRAAEHTGARAS